MQICTDHDCNCHNHNVDTVNNFVQVSFESSTLNLNFINQPKEGEKFYEILYGPITQGCKNLSSNITGHISNVMSFSLRLNYLEGTQTCFNLFVNNGTRSVRVEGMYVSGKQP